jgi:hypothetical protein
MAAKPPDDADQKSGSPARFKGHPRSPAKFREREVARAVRAANRAGGVARVELMPDGRIQMILVGQAPAADSNPWDEVSHAAD